MSAEPTDPGSAPPSSAEHPTVEAVITARFPDTRLEGILNHAQALRSLLGQSDDDFLLRFAVAEEMARSPRLRWGSSELNAALGWMRPTERERTLGAMRRGGWLEGAGYHQVRLSRRGASLLAALSETFGLLPGDEAELAFGVLRLEWAGTSGVSPGPMLRHLLHQVHRVLDETEQALASRSEAAIADAGHRIDANLRWAARCREVLERVEVSTDDDLEVARNLGRSMARLHQSVGRLQRALNALGRARVPLGASGLTLADVAAWIGRCAPDRLAELGEGLVHQPARPVVGIVDNLLTEAEVVMCAEVFESDSEAVRGWERAADPTDAADAGIETPWSPEQDPVAEISRDLVRWALAEGETSLASAVAAPSFAQVAHRLAMLSLAEEGTFPFDSEAAADVAAQGPGTARVPALVIRTEGDGSESEESFTGALREVSCGAIRAFYDDERTTGQSP